jgi:hypothetical protein
VLSNVAVMFERYLFLFCLWGCFLVVVVEFRVFAGFLDFDGSSAGIEKDSDWVTNVPTRFVVRRSCFWDHLWTEKNESRCVLNSGFLESSKSQFFDDNGV